MEIPSLLEFIKAGVHFGHKKEKWHPKMNSYIYEVRQGIHLIDLEKTVEKLKIALEFLKNQTKEGKTILFLGTKPQAKEIIKKNAERLKIPYVTERWLGGTLTNFSTILKLVEKLKKMEKDKENGLFDKYPKKERIKIDKEIEKLKKFVGGIKNLDKLPSAIFIIDFKEEKIAIKEARKMKIPIVAIVDTNCNPELVDYPIPANDDAIDSLELITDLVAKAIEEGQGESKNQKSNIKNKI